MKDIKSKQVVVIGAGAGGLAVAGLLAKAGFKVTIYEANSDVGGRMGLYEADGFKFDTGPSWYLMPEVYEHYFNLFNKTAADYLDLMKLSPAYQVYFQEESGPIIITGDEAVDGQTFEEREVGAADALKRYLNSAEETYKLSLKYFLYHDFSHLHKLAKMDIIKHAPAMLRSATTSLDDHVQRYFTDPGLRQIIGYPAVFLGSSPYTAPSIYHLMSYLDFRQGVFYPKGGMYSVTQALRSNAEGQGVEIVLDSPVTSIVTNDGKATGIVLGDGNEITADIIVSNADLHFTQTELLAENDRDYPSKYWEEKEAGPSALLMYLGVEGELPTLKHHNLFFAENWKENFDNIFGENQQWPEPASMYVSMPSATDDSLAPIGHENLFILVPLPANVNLNHNRLHEFADSYINQLAVQAGIPDLRKRIVTEKIYGPKDFATELHAWKGTALGLSHTLKQSALFRPKTKSKKVKNLYYVGANVQPGVGVPMCLISAELIYKDLLGDHSLGPMHTEQG